MKFGIFTNKSNIDLSEFYSFLIKKSIQYCHIDEISDLSDLDYAWIFGGDGTILRIATILAKNNIPALCVNCGTIGFLTEFEKVNLQSICEDLLSNKLDQTKRMLIEVSFNGKNYTALNELVVQRDSGFEGDGLIAKLGVKIDNQLADEICGDGVIISTPSGSTAYSLSAGGSIISTGLQAIGITPICAHSLHNRPIVCSGDSNITVQNDGNTSALLIIDGFIVDKLKKDEKVYVRKSNLYFVCLKNKDSNFFDKLLCKLNRRG